MLTDLMQNTMGFVHEVLPPEFGWLGAVAVSAVTVRALLFPLTINSIREGRLKSSLFPQYSEMLREMAEMKTPSSAPHSKDSEKLQALQKRYISFTSKYGNVAMKGTLASGIQIPMILTGIVACNGIAMHPAVFPAVALESPLWLTSASLPDPLYILPAINAGFVWFNMKVFGSLDASITPKQINSSTSNPKKKLDQVEEDEQSKRLKELITSRMGRDSAERTSQQIDAFYKSKTMHYGKKMFPLFIFGITMNFPAVTLVYTISNILGAMAQNWLVTNPRFQRVFDIPAQAKRSGDQVEEALKRAEEIRDRINQIVKERRSKRQQIEEAAKTLLRRPQTPHAARPDIKAKTVQDLLQEVKQRRTANIK
jgi:membrane protein insertase Oxa1/YidC/SpoIIIJ